MSNYSASAFASSRAATRVGIDRMLLVCVVLLAGALFWIAPLPPMGDLPQHAAQITLLRDLFAGTSNWADLVRINYFTPYLAGYGLAFVLSFVMPVLAAMKLLMTLAFYGFVFAGVKLRKRLDGDARLDWLFIPGFFGFAFQYGFYTFLIATPLALFFMLLAERFARRPTIGGGAGIVAAGIVMFFSHGLVFLFACAVGATFVLIVQRRIARVLLAWIPYALLALVIVAYLLHVRHSDLVMPESATSASGFEWGWALPWGWHRVYNFVLYVVGSEMKDWYFLLATLFLLAAPWLMGARLNRSQPLAFVPMAGVVAIWFLVPATAMDIMLLYHRFAIFLLPAYALMFTRPDLSDRFGGRRALAGPVMIAVVAICVSFLATLAVREHRFASEDASFEAMVSQLEPDQRALSLMFDPGSTIMHDQYTYHTWPLWYQAQRHGFVDYNFAIFLPQIVRFRPDRVPPMRPEYDWKFENFNWQKVNGRLYRYFFVRHAEPLPANLFANDECDVRLVKETGEWSVFERGVCH